LQGKSIILIVDDADSGRETLSSLLTTPDYELAYARNGPEALAQAEALMPDLVLLDVMMPGMTGFDVCRRLRVHPLLKEVPIILVTALDDRPSRLEGLDAGADDFVTKPIDRAELRVRVRTVTRLNRYQRLLKERERFVWVVEQASDGYLVLDQAHAILYANRAAQVMLDLPEPLSLPLADSFFALVARRFRCEPERQWQAWLANEEQASQRLYLIWPETATAPAIWLEVTVRRQFSNTEVNQLVHLRDVSVERSTQRDTWTFHSMVMHKLNTPLQTVLGSLEMLSPGTIQTISQEEVSIMAEFAYAGVHRLSKTIADILKYLSVPFIARRGEGLQLAQLPALIQQIGADLGINVQVLHEFALADRRLKLSHRALEALLWELLENSRKFHPTQLPQVEVSLAVLRADQLQLRVMDNGINLNPEQILRVWSPYYQGERYFTGERPGIGLGLSMVAALVWEVGGDCRFRNREDGPGVIVDLFLPLAEPGATPADDAELISY